MKIAIEAEGMFIITENISLGVGTNNVDGRKCVVINREIMYTHRKDAKLSVEDIIYFIGYNIREGLDKDCQGLSFNLDFLSMDIGDYFSKEIAAHRMSNSKVRSDEGEYKNYAIK